TSTVIESNIDIAGRKPVRLDDVDDRGVDLVRWYSGRVVEAIKAGIERGGNSLISLTFPFPHRSGDECPRHVPEVAVGTPWSQIDQHCLGRPNDVVTVVVEIGTARSRPNDGIAGVGSSPHRECRVDHTPEPLRRKGIVLPQ